MTSPRFAAVQWPAFIVVLGALLYLLSPILTPFVAAAILAYICNPAVQRLARFRMPRTLAVLLVMLALLVASVLAGLLWDSAGAASTFIAGAAFCVLTLAMIVLRR